jgi:putative RNA 2'-phosphotransferase
MNYSKLSHTISQALRHTPQDYGLCLDSLGFVPCADLFKALAKCNLEWQHLSKDDIEAAMASSSKRRFEIIGDKIRATYGHSVPGVCAGELKEPPEFLYHGTTQEATEKILVEGLKPMGRNYVHLSVDTAVAETVAKRHGTHTVILKILAHEAYLNNIHFWYCNDTTWNAEYIPIQFIAK